MCVYREQMIVLFVGFGVVQMAVVLIVVGGGGGVPSDVGGQDGGEED